MSDLAPNRNDHVPDLLPGLVNGTLDEATAGSVRLHLARCAACAAELSQWEAIQSSMRLVAALEAEPSPALLDRVWATLDAEPAAFVFAPHLGRSVVVRASAAARFVRAQILVLPRGIWAVSATAIAVSLVTVLVMRAPSEVVTRMLLSLIIPLVTALGTAFLSGPENDAALEVVLATPVSPRLVAATRVGLVLVYNCVLATLLTLAVSLGHGSGFAPLASLWFGPALLIGAVSLLMSVVSSSVMGVAGAAFLLIVRLATLLGGLPQSASIPWVTELDRGWTTSPLVLALAVACLAAALLWTPRQVRHLAWVWMPTSTRNGKKG